MAEYKRFSRYYPGCDGTKIAVDLYLPVTELRVPVLVECGYDDRRRAFDMRKETLERFLEAGDALALIEPRGSGARSGPGTCSSSGARSCSSTCTGPCSSGNSCSGPCTSPCCGTGPRSGSGKCGNEGERRRTG